MRNAECGIARSGNSVHGAGAPSPPSSEGGEAAPPRTTEFTKVQAEKPAPLCKGSRSLLGKDAPRAQIKRSRAHFEHGSVFT